jgi:hypothetical protein
MSGQRLLTWLGVLGVVILLGVGIGYLATRNTGLNSQLSGSNPAPSSTNSANPNNQASSTKLLPDRPHVWPTNANLPNSVGASAAVSPGDLITNWEDKVDEILGADGDEAEKAKKMLEMFPRLPEEGKVEVAQHLSNLVPDEGYEPLGKILTNSTLPEDVLDVLLSDALNRPNSIKLPLMLDIAQDPQHPKTAEAKDMLELFLEEDYGSDWPKWQAKMEQWLKENPD